jgi:hypothetical protein
MTDEDSVFACRICHEPVKLETDTCVDEEGKSVHEECYIKEISEARRKDLDQPE